MVFRVVVKLRAKFFFKQTEGTTAVRPLVHDRSPGVREYGDRTGDGLCRMGHSQRMPGTASCGAAIVWKKLPRGVRFPFLAGIPARNGDKNKKRASRRCREARNRRPLRTEFRLPRRLPWPEPLWARARRGRACARRQRGWTTR